MKDPFAFPKISVFVLNIISFGLLCGNRKSVYYNYSKEHLQKEPLLINSITCNISSAETLWNPKKQFQKIEKPFGLYIGKEDELFDPRKVIRYFDYVRPEIKNKSEALIVERQRHLSILLSADNFIGEFIQKNILANK